MRAITILSGGLDSTVSTAIARKKHKIVLALTFDYGQRAAKREIEAARSLCKIWKIKHEVIKLPWLAKITNTALVNKTKLLPRFSTQALKHQSTQALSVKTVWVPNRNALFINIAASYAERLDARAIIVGFNKEEASTFPDNGEKFVHYINQTLKFSTLLHPKVVSYVQKMTKVEIMRLAFKKSIPIEYCWPCYRGGKQLCMKCESCIRFFESYKKYELSL